MWCIRALAGAVAPSRFDRPSGKPQINDRRDMVVVFPQRHVDGIILAGGRARDNPVPINVAVVLLQMSAPNSNSMCGCSRDTNLVEDGAELQDHPLEHSVGRNKSIDERKGILANGEVESGLGLHL